MPATQNHALGGGQDAHATLKACRYCTGPNRELSTGGPDVCCLCEVHGVPPNVFMGWKAPWDFHATRRRGIFQAEASTLLGGTGHLLAEAPEPGGEDA